MEPRVDWKGVEIKLGSRVTDTDDRVGTVNHLGDWDGEPDGETGLMRGIAPQVCVTWDDGTEGYYTTDPVFVTESHPRWAVDRFVDRLDCDDLEVVK